MKFTEAQLEKAVIVLFESENISHVLGNTIQRELS